MSELPKDWRTCAADLFEHREVVLERLARQNASIDKEDLHDAFVQTILEIASNPEKFDASRQTKLVDFLVGASQRNLLQLLRTNRRRKNREEIKSASVAEETSVARSIVDELADSELAQMARAVAQSDQERKLLELWELGHSDAEMAAQLAIPLTEVKLVRDRLTLRLRRLKPRIHDDKMQ